MTEEQFLKIRQFFRCRNELEWVTGFPGNLINDDPLALTLYVDIKWRSFRDELEKAHRDFQAGE